MNATFANHIYTARKDRETKKVTIFICQKVRSMCFGVWHCAWYCPVSWTCAESCVPQIPTWGQIVTIFSPHLSRVICFWVPFARKFLLADFSKKDIKSDEKYSRTPFCFHFSDKFVSVCNVRRICILNKRQNLWKHVSHESGIPAARDDFWLFNPGAACQESRVHPQLPQ